MAESTSTIPRTRRGKKKQAAQRVALAAQGTLPTGSTPAAEIASSSTKSPFALVAVEDTKKRKRKPGEIKLPGVLRDRALIRLPYGRKLTQQEHLPPTSLPGRGALQTFLEIQGSSSAQLFAEQPYTFEDTGDSGGVWFTPAEPQRASRHHRRQLQQHDNWNRQLLLKLVREYLVWKTGRGEAHATTAQCSCSSPRKLNVTLGDWKGTRQRLLNWPIVLTSM